MRDIEPNRVLLGDNLTLLPDLATGSYQMIYLDPPFNTGKAQTRTSIKVAAIQPDTTVASGHSTPASSSPPGRIGFGGRRYNAETTGTATYADANSDYLGWLRPRLEQVHRLLHATGTLYFHIDYREAHYCKVLLDEIFGRDAFLNELIWAYDFGGRARDRWPAKHDTILVYVRTPGAHFFDQDAIERIPYMAPGLVGPEKAARGKLPTDVWWHTIVSPTGREKTGYPTQKPEGILRRMVQASTRPGDMVGDFFAGSGTTGAVAHSLGRRFVLIDQNPQAIDIIRRRIGADGVVYS